MEIVTVEWFSLDDVWATKYSLKWFGGHKNTWLF